MKNFRQGDKVETPLGPGSVAYVRFGAGVPQAVSVVLDSKRDRSSYTGTIFSIDQVEEAA